MAKPVMKITPDQVIARILEMIKAVPDQAAGLPEGANTPQFWKKIFSATPRSRRMMKTLQETPAFTNQAPAKASDWPKTLKKHFVSPPAEQPNQVMHILRDAISRATPPVRPPVKYWRDRFAASETIQRVRPAETDEYLHNPHRGTTTFQRFQGDDTYVAWITSDTHGPVEFSPNAPLRDNVKYQTKTTLTYVRWPWAWFEPKKGQYNWKLVDLSLKTAHNRGQTVQVRFQPFTLPVDYSVTPAKSRRHPPGQSVNMPDWYWDTGAKWIEQGPYMKHEPDSNDPKYIKHFGDFIRAFAARYDGHPDLESVDMAYAGVWGESGGNSNAATAAKLTDIYLKSFKKTTLLSMLGTDGSKYSASVTRRTGRPIGWRADCFGDLRKHYKGIIPPDLAFNHTFDAYPMQIVQDGLKDSWQTAPVTMETCGNVGTWFMEDYDLDLIVREGYRYHMSVFMPKNVFYPQEWQEKLAEFDRRIGYRFVLRQLILPLEAKAAQKINLQFYFDNVGCAPIYRPYALAIRFRQDGKSKVVRLKADIRQWMPGHTWFEENITVPAGLKKGFAKVDICIVDEKDNPKVWLAIQGRTDDGWHPLTCMDIV